MKEWIEVQQLLLDNLVRFLDEMLPKIGGQDWWNRYVLNNLTPNQVKVVGDLEAGDLAGLDLAALLRITEQNLSELHYKRSLDWNAKSLLVEIRNARNQNAHTSAAGISLRDRQRTVDTASRLLDMLKAPQADRDQLSRLHFALLQEMLQQSDRDPPADDDTLSSPADPPSDVWPKSTAPSRTDSVGDDDEIGVQCDPGPESGTWIVDKSAHTRAIQDAVYEKTFVGIDFGTSTSVASVMLRNSAGAIEAQTLHIEQPDEYGRCINSHLVNSVLAWRRDNLLFGVDAYRLKPEMVEGQNIFSSFKMRLGINIGPTYPATLLPRGRPHVTIEDANDATREFFKLLSRGITKAINDKNLPRDTCFAVTVPASFEANQRRDLLLRWVVMILTVRSRRPCCYPSCSSLHQATTPMIGI
jgi:molecular chaperone DnaK